VTTTAGNLLLLASLGGPQAITDYARTPRRHDDPASTASSRDLNEAVPGDPRDTTTPQAMLGNVRQLVLGKALVRGVERATDAMGSAATRPATHGFAPDCRPAGSPATRPARASAARRTTSVWSGRRRRAPIAVTIYYTEDHGHRGKKRNAVLAAVGLALCHHPGLTDYGRGSGLY